MSDLFFILAFALSFTLGWAACWAWMAALYENMSDELHVTSTECLPEEGPQGPV